MSEVLDGLKAGMRRFREEVYPERAELYQRAVNEAQRPDTLMITCADSRIQPEELLQTDPGQVFVTRNIGNIVPAYGEMMGAVSAVLEYAVSALEVKHLVVCGHTDCGAMKALLHPSSTEGMPTVTRWLQNAHTALAVAEARVNQGESANLLQTLTEQNVLLQMQHVLTHPSVAGAVARGKLTLSGWVYDIGAGEVRICEDGSGVFKRLTNED